MCVAFCESCTKDLRSSEGPKIRVNGGRSREIRLGPPFEASTRNFCSRALLRTSKHRVSDFPRRVRQRAYEDGFVKSVFTNQ